MLIEYPLWKILRSIIIQMKKVKGYQKWKNWNFSSLKTFKINMEQQSTIF